MLVRCEYFASIFCGDLANGRSFSCGQSNECDEVHKNANKMIKKDQLS